MPDLDPRLGRIVIYRPPVGFSAVAPPTYRPELTLNGAVIGKAIPGGFFWIDRPPGNYTLLIVGNSDYKWKPTKLRIEGGQTEYVRVLNWPPDEPLTHAEEEIKKMRYDGAIVDPAVSAKEALRQISADEQNRRIAKEQREMLIAQLMGQDAGTIELFKLQPSEQFTVTEITKFLISWKNRHLDGLLQKAKTEEMRDYADQIEHTILEAADSSEKEKDEAQRLAAGGAGGENEHTELARAYRLRIEVLKPILAAIKEEIANRGK